MDVYAERQAEYLAFVDWQMVMWSYEVWRLAYARGLVTAAELSRFLVAYERQM